MIYPKNFDFSAGFLWSLKGAAISEETESVIDFCAHPTINLSD
jgi:hypothetical protein